MGEKIKLKNAIENCSGLHNSYNWFRECAKEDGCIYLANIEVPVVKEKGIWYIDEDEFNNAVQNYRAKQEEKPIDMLKIIENKQKSTYHQKTTPMDYNPNHSSNYGDFRFEWNDYDVARRKSDGNWYCNSCDVLADTEHNKRECHTCSDWNGCGTDCTLSKVYCSHCGKYLLM